MKEPSPTPQIVALTSSRPEGVTSLAIALAATLSQTRRTLLMDLNPGRAEVAPMLNLDDNQNVYQLAHRARLGPVSPCELEAQVRSYRGLEVLPGVIGTEQAKLLDEKAIFFLLAAARPLFPGIVVDLGRAHLKLPSLPEEAVLLWVLTPTRVGLASFDRAIRPALSARPAWLRQVQIVINQMRKGHSLGRIYEFVRNQYGLPLAGTIPYEPQFWGDLEDSCAIQALGHEMDRPTRFERKFGKPALTARQALEKTLEQAQAQHLVREDQYMEARGDGAAPGGRIARAIEPSRGVDPGRVPARAR